MTDHLNRAYFLCQRIGGQLRPSATEASQMCKEQVSWAGRVSQQLQLAVRALVLCAALLAQSPPTHAEQGTLLKKGDAAVTSFAGVAPRASPPKDVHPLDLTFIDPSKPTLQVFDLSKLGGPPDNQLASAPVIFDVKASEIGHVFGVTFDAQPDGIPANIYVGASSLFGLQIIEPGPDGKPNRLVKGSPRAQWMPGQFGLDKGGGPGAIWKIDGVTGTVSLFSNITSGNFENAGPGLAGLAFDPVSIAVYATSLETGLIHALDARGREFATFDHGVTARTQAGLKAVADVPSTRMDIHSPSFNIEDPNSWGYADAKRRVMAMAVDSGRLYYSVAEGPVIWSVGLAGDGSFMDDARIEIDVTGTPNGNAVTAMTFDGPETLYVTQRGEPAGSYDYSTFARPQTSVVTRYTFDANKRQWNEAPEEYPIGLEPVHRATNGGVALGYGYDKNGDIDYGQCRQTLWTTGEQLRAGAGDQDSVDGLQGNDKSLAQIASEPTTRSGSTALQGQGARTTESGLTPPKAAWFTDNDGQFKDRRAHAHIGAIAILNVCAPGKEPKRLAAAKPRSTPGIYIDKVCFPANGSGQVRCDITLINTGITPKWPVSFTETSAILFGAGAGTVVPITSASPDGPDFICSPTPSAAFSCWLPPEGLPAGKTRTVTVFVNSGAISSGGNFVFSNCASLDAPHHGQACWQSGSELTVTKSGPATCAAGGSCTFSLTIANNTSAPFAGNITLSDSMFQTGASTAVAVTSMSPANICNGGGPAALPFTCASAQSLQPGQSKTISMTVTMPAAPPNYWAQNCFAASPAAFSAAGAPPAPFPSSPGAGGTNGTPACAWVAVGNPPPFSNLLVEKFAGPCGKTPAGNVRCSYNIVVTNTGPSPFNNTISLNDTVGATSTLASADGSLACVPGGGGGNTCNSVAAITLASNQSITFPVTVDTPKLVIDAAACFSPNTVTLLAPPVGPQNANGADDTATAVADAALLQFFDPATGITTVLCDPANLRTVKISNGDCVKQGGGYECGYKVVVANMGPDPYLGPINVTETMPGATSATFGPGWTCTGAGSTFQCSKPPLKMAKGETFELDVKATFPDNGACIAANTATMTVPPANTRFNTSGADDSATASSVIPSQKCLEKPACAAPGDGEFQSQSGACACSEGYTRDRKGRCAKDEAPEPPQQSSPEPQATACPDGYPIPKSGVCPCPSGATWNADRNICDAACEPGRNEYRTSSGQCLCKSGYDRDGDGQCTTGNDRPSPPPIRVIEDDRCELGPNEVRTSHGNCICRDGFDRDRRGTCVREFEPEPDRPRCDRNEYRSSKGYCVCENGFERNRQGECVPEYREPERERCGAYEHNNSRGYCVCDSGYVRHESGRCIAEEWDCPPSMDYDERRGKCVPHEGPVREVCSARQYRAQNGRCECKVGYVQADGDCVTLRRECPKGYSGNYPNCVMNRPEGKPVPERPDCGPRGFFNGNRCQCENGYSYQDSEICKPDRPPADSTKKPNPKEACRQDGGKWVNGDCQVPHGNTPMEDCVENGGKWDDGRCIAGGSKAPDKTCPEGTRGTYPNCKPVETKEPTPAQQCAARGGSYEEGNCVLPNGKSSDKVQDNQTQKQLEKQQEILRQKQLEKQQEIQKQKQLEKQQEIQKQKQREKQQEIQKQKQLEKQQQLKNQQQDKGKNGKKDKDKDTEKTKDKGTCPPGKVPDPSKGGKCTTPS